MVNAQLRDTFNRYFYKFQYIFLLLLTIEILPIDLVWPHTKKSLKPLNTLVERSNDEDTFVKVES